MKELNVYVWWSIGMDGDGYDETIQVTDEVYNILKEINASGDELSEIDDKRISDSCKRYSEQLIEALKDESPDDSEFESYRVGVYITEEFD